MNILVTGGAGFIGSHIVDVLLRHPAVDLVRVLDNFSTGSRGNLPAPGEDERLDMMEGDIRRPEDCRRACEGMHAVCHQAALGSVPRSLADPVTSHEVNVTGFVNMLEAARAAGIRRFVYASSSSVYGDSPRSPKQEAHTGGVLSPYAATKAANEVYAQAWFRGYGMQLVGFRYFNVFGPRQDPDGPYAAVIPRFIKAAMLGKPPRINGDGSITRDFTPVANVVQANLAALMLNSEEAFHEVVNIACGRQTTLLELWQLIAGITGATAAPEHGPQRPGDVLHSLADISRARNLLGYEPDTDIRAALSATVAAFGKQTVGS